MGDEARGRFRVEPGTLVVGAVRLGRGESRHVRVMRLRPGARVRLFDGAGVEAEAELSVVPSGDDPVEARVLSVGETPQPALRVRLVQALPVKLQRMEMIVRQATELGVTRIAPVLAERSQVPSGGRAVLERRLGRWKRIAEAAAKQCGRSTVPVLEPLAEVASALAARSPQACLVLAPQATRSLAEWLAAWDLDGPQGADLTLLVGPEGGWSARELATALESEAQPVGLGPRVLRADTAGIVALAAIQSLRGDLR